MTLSLRKWSTPIPMEVNAIILIDASCLWFILLNSLREVLLEIYYLKIFLVETTNFVTWFFDIPVKKC